MKKCLAYDNGKIFFRTHQWVNKLTAIELWKMKHRISNKLIKHIYDNRNAAYAPIFQTDSPIGKMKAVNCCKT